MDTSFAVKAIFKAVDRLTRPVRGMTRGVKGFGMSAEKSLRKVDRGLMKVHSGIKRAAVAAGIAATAIAALGGNIIATGGTFEQAITNVGAVGLKTREEIAALEQKALDLGAKTKFTATESANAMEILAKAGFTSSQILGSVDGVLSAAAASGLQIAEVADHVASTMKGMNLEVIDAKTGLNNATRVADVLALASSRTNSSIGSLGESLKNVSGTASDLGIGLEDTVGAVALLQDVGLDASVAGSELNTMLTKIAAGTGAVSKRAKDANGNLKPFPELLAIISDEAAKSGGNMDRVAFLADLVGLRGQKAASKLSRLFDTGKVESLTAELHNATGVAEKMAELRMNTFQGDVLKLEAAVDGVKTSLFNLQSGPLRGVVQGMTKWIDANKDLITSGVESFFTTLSNNMEDIQKWGKRIAIVVGVFYGVAAAVKAATIAATLFNLVVSANPITLIAIGIVAAVALLLAFWPEVTAFLQKTWNSIKAGGEALFGWVKDLFQKIVDAGGLFHLLWKGIKAGWSALVDFILGGGVVGLVIRNWSTIKPALLGVFDSVKAGAAAVFDWIKEKLMQAVGWALNALSKYNQVRKSIISSAGDFLFGKGDESSDGASNGSAALPPPGGAPVMGAGSIARSEQVTRGEARLTIRDKTQRAELDGDTSGPGFSFNLQPSGAL